MRAEMMRRLAALETRLPVRGVEDMTDDELFDAIGIRNPTTGAMRRDLTDDELAAMVGGR